MRGHTGTVTDTAIIGIGRNVVSSSLDKKVRLWDVSSGEAIATLFTNGPVTAMTLGDRTPAPPDGEESLPPPPGDQREVAETSSKLVFCALKNGSFQTLDLGFKKSIYVSPPSSSSLTSIAYSPSSLLLATGSSSGVVTLYDTRSLNGPLTSFTRLKSEIEDIAFVSQNSGSGSISVAIATSDGLPYVASIQPEGPAIYAELVGVDCDAVRHVVARDCKNRMVIWSAGDDGVVRRYLL
jgi:proteasomal ATPase-associated factor 1